MRFVSLIPEEFEEFTSERFSHYTQPRIRFDNRNEMKHDVHAVGVKDDSGDVIAATLMTEARALKSYKCFYTHRGPVMDYSNIKLVHFFFRPLTGYLKEQNCPFVLVDPYILEDLCNADEEILESYDNRAVIKTLEDLGYKHQGWSVGYSTISQIRWLSILDPKNKTEDQLLKEMDYQARRNIKKTYEMGVKVRTLPMEGTHTFFELFQMAEERHGLKFRDEPYFCEMQKIYRGHVMLRLAYIDLKDYLSTLQHKHEDLTKQPIEIEEALKESPNSKKNKNKRNQLQQQSDSNRRRINQTKNKIAVEGEVLNLTATLYIYNEHRVYYLSSGSNPKYNEYVGVYRSQWKIIKFTKEHNVNRYNFYGITGDLSENVEDYGIRQFKRGFNAGVYEYTGDFIKPTKPVLYHTQQWIKNRR